MHGAATRIAGERWLGNSEAWSAGSSSQSATGVRWSDCFGGEGSDDGCRQRGEVVAVEVGLSGRDAPGPPVLGRRGGEKRGELGERTVLRDESRRLQLPSPAMSAGLVTSRSAASSSCPRRSRASSLRSIDESLNAAALASARRLRMPSAICEDRSSNSCSSLLTKLTSTSAIAAAPSMEEDAGGGGGNAAAWRV